MILVADRVGATRFRAVGFTLTAMPRRSGRWIALIVLAVIGGLIALVLTGRGALQGDDRQVIDRWKTLRAPLTQRYDLLAAAGATTAQLGDRSVTDDISKGVATWQASLRRSGIDAQIAAANDLEGLARRLDANVAASTKLRTDTDVQAALAAFHQSAPAQPLVDGFDDATARYARDRTSAGRRLAAALFGFDPRPALRLT